LGKSQEEIADAAGIPLSTYKKYESETDGDSRVPGGEALAGLMRAGVDIEFVLIGKARERGLALHAEQPRAGYAYMSLLDARAAPGKGAAVETEGMVDVLAFKEDWIRHELRTTSDKLRLIYVEGDSMEPDLRAGDIALIDHTDISARREGIYVLRIDDALLVKMLQRLPGGVIKVTSRNESYEPFSLKADELEASPDIAIIGRVVWACRRF